MGSYKYVVFNQQFFVKSFYVKSYRSIYKITDDVFLLFIDIQEFYEVTLLNSQKSCEQKIKEADQIAQKWEKTSLLVPCCDNSPKSTEVHISKRMEDYYNVSNLIVMIVIKKGNPTIVILLYQTM